MERGLLWLPLLGIFIGLAWAGRREYQKLEAYQRWAEDFDNAKYDIYAVLGHRGSTLTWGTPTRSGPTDLETIDFTAVQSLQVEVDGHFIDRANPPQQAKRPLLIIKLAEHRVAIPFTDVSLAIQWVNYLEAQGRLGAQGGAGDKS